MQGFNWEVLAVLLTVVALLNGGLIWGVKFLLDRTMKHIDTQLQDLKEQYAEDSKELVRIEKEFLQFRAQLPEQYVMRTDWIRFSNVIDEKQDRLNDKFEALLRRLGDSKS